MTNQTPSAELAIQWLAEQQTTAEVMSGGASEWASLSLEERTDRAEVAHQRHVVVALRREIAPGADDGVEGRRPLPEPQPDERDDQQRPAQRHQRQAVVRDRAVSRETEGAGVSPGARLTEWT